MKLITKLKALLGNQPEAQGYDRERLRPVIRASICTGEQVAGFQNRQTGRFSEVMLIRTDADLAEFIALYGISPQEITTEY